MIECFVATLAEAASLLVAASAVQAASCGQVPTHGGKSQYSVMEFGRSDKLYVHIVRLPEGWA